MPAFPIDYPSAVGLFPAKVRWRRVRAQAAFENELTLQSQVQIFAAKVYAIDIELQRMDRGDAATLDAWLDSLNGREGTFNFDLDPWVRGALPGIRVFRLASPDDEFDCDLAVDFGCAFSAMEVPAS